jgi:hypothetical protein
MKSKSKTITIRVNQETADHCDRLRLAGAHKAYMNSAFARVIFNTGLAPYEKGILPIERENITTAPDRLAAGCETVTEATRRIEAKIIPFPGVSTDREITYQNALDDFLREIGYVED